MKIGICEKDLTGNLEENLKFIDENGFDGFQIWPDKITDVKELMKQCSELGLVISAIGGGPNLVKPEEKGKTIEAFRKRFDLAAETESFIVTAETKEKPPEMSEKDAWESCTEIVKTVCDYAEKTGGLLAIEPSGSCFVKDYNDWAELARRVDSSVLKVNYDPANIIWAGKDPAEGVKKLGSNIVHTHAKNVIFEKQGGYQEGTALRKIKDVSADRGEVDYRSYIKSLKDVGYQGFLTIEMHHKNEKEILKSRQFLEKLLKNI